MKFGYIREDGVGHQMVIPEELIEEFDSFDDKFEGKTSEECEKLHTEWDKKFNTYYADAWEMKVVMEE